MIGVVTSQTRNRLLRPPEGPVCLNTDSPQAVGLVAFWPLQGRSAKAYRDYAGRGAHHLTEIGTTPVLPGFQTSWSPSYTANAANYLAVAGVPATGPPFTVGLWFQVDHAGNDYALWSAANTAGDHYFIIFTGFSSLALSAGAAAAGSPQRANTAATLVANTWTHGCAVFASNTSRAAYLNGGSKGTNANSNTPLSVVRHQLGVGPSLSNYPMGGKLSHTCIWNVAKTDAEVLELVDPATRWDLYYRLERRVYFFPSAPPAVGPRVNSLLLVGAGR